MLGSAGVLIVHRAFFEERTCKEDGTMGCQNLTLWPQAVYIDILGQVNFTLFKWSAILMIDFMLILWAQTEVKLWLIVRLCEALAKQSIGLVLNKCHLIASLSSKWRHFFDINFTSVWAHKKFIIRIAGLLGFTAKATERYSGKRMEIHPDLFEVPSLRITHELTHGRPGI